MKFNQNFSTIFEPVRRSVKGKTIREKDLHNATNDHQTETLRIEFIDSLV